MRKIIKLPRLKVHQGIMKVPNMTTSMSKIKMQAGFGSSQQNMPRSFLPECQSCSEQKLPNFSLVPHLTIADMTMDKRVAIHRQRPRHLAHRESGGLRPDVSVVAADDGVLHHLGGHQLVVHVRLPRHAAAAAIG